MSTTPDPRALSDADLVAAFLAHVQPRGALTQKQASAELTACGYGAVSQATISRWIIHGAQSLHAGPRRALEAYLGADAVHPESAEPDTEGVEMEEDLSLAADRNLVRQVLAATDHLAIRAAAQVAGISPGTIQRWREGLPQRRISNDLRNAARAYLQRIGKNAPVTTAPGSASYIDRAFALLEIDAASGRDLSAAFLRRSDAILQLTALLAPEPVARSVVPVEDVVSRRVESENGGASPTRKKDDPEAQPQ